PIGGVSSVYGFPMRLRGTQLRLDRLVCATAGFHPGSQLRQSFLLIGQWGLHKRLFGPVVPDEAVLVGHLIEVCEQAIEILLRDGVVLVIVAARASGGEPQPNGSG